MFRGEVVEKVLGAISIGEVIQLDVGEYRKHDEDV